MRPQLRLRPFKEYLEREQGQPMLELCGRIEGERFVVTVLQHEIELETVGTGTDHDGTFALVLPCDRDLADGFRIRVETERDEDGTDEVILDVYLEGHVRQAFRRGLRERGHDPNAILPEAPYARCFSVHFDQAGYVCGTGSVLHDSESPTVN